MTKKNKSIGNFPNLRFQGFDGEWELKRLGDLTDVITKGTTPKKFVNQGVKYIKIECFDGNKINLKKCLFINEETHNKELRRSILKENDLLFAIAGATIGKINIVTNDILPANTNQALAIIRLKKNENSKFIYQILKSDIMQKYIKDSISVGAQPNLNLQQMNDFSFFHPTSSEQLKISSLLNQVDERIQTQKKIITEVKSQMQVLEDLLLTGKLRLNDNDGNSFNNWTQEKLSNIGKTYNGLSGKTKDDFGSGKKYIQYKQIFDSSRIDICKCAFVNISANENQNAVQFGDIFFTVSSETPEEIGMSSVLLEDVENVFLNSFCFGFRTHSFEKLIPEFSQFFFRSKVFRNEIVKLAQGSTRYNISKSEFLKLKVILPSKDEQIKIANALASIDEKIETEKKILAQYETQKKYLLANLFV